MERDELNRLRQQLEQLYQQVDLEIDHSFLRSSFHSPIEAKHAIAIDRPTGLWQTLQTLWQHASAFLTEASTKESNDSSPSKLTWWQMYPARTGADMPVLFPGDSEQLKHWLERIYHIKSTGIDHRR